MDFKELELYRAAMKLGELTWNLVIEWTPFEKYSIGEQWVESADSVAANISEGEGRYNYPDRKRFYYMSRGSLNESETWLTKSHQRKLITEQQFHEYLDLIDQCRKMLNSCIYKFKQRTSI